jgi:hypothetical protein
MVTLNSLSRVVLKKFGMWSSGRGLPFECSKYCVTKRSSKLTERMVSLTLLTCRQFYQTFLLVTKVEEGKKK